MLSDVRWEPGSRYASWTSDGKVVTWESPYALGQLCILPDSSGIAAIPSLDSPDDAPLAIVNEDGTVRLAIRNPLGPGGDYSYYTIAALGAVLYVVLASRRGDIGVTIDPLTGNVLSQSTAR